MSLMPFEVNRDYRSLKRFLRILETMARYGFYDLTENIHPIKKIYSRKSQEELAGKSRPEKLRLLLEELGPSFVKLGQILSTRPDLISQKYADELSKLTEQVTPFSGEEVRKIIQQELKQPPEKLFLSFSEKPLAAASIGQVHAARLHDGTEVVVKIQRPGIKETIELDLDIMLYIARKLEDFNETLARNEPVKIVGEFAYSLRRELNYQFEAANLLRFTNSMKDSPGLVIPKLYLNYTTTKVLTMERIFGDSATKVLEHPELRAKYDLPLVAHLGVNLMLKQIFETGFFHADPHPGNLFLLEGNRVAFIDFGMMGRIDEQERRDFVRIIDYMLRGEISSMTDCALRMTITGTYEGDREELERDVADLVDENINLPLDKISVSHILEELMELFRKYSLSLKPNLYMMFKALISIEHLGRTFDPALKIVDMVKPFIERLKWRSYDPMPHLRRFLDNFGDNLSALETLPTTLRKLITSAENGNLTLRVEHHRLDAIEQTMYVTGERLSRSMLVTALLIGTALIIVAKIPPFWNDIPIIGMFGFAVSAVLGVIILIDDHWQRRKFLKERARRKLDAKREKRNE